MLKPNKNRSYIPDLVFEMYFEMWEYGETNCHGVSAIYVRFFSAYIISVCYNFVKDIPASDALNTASLELLRQEQSTAEQSRLTPRTYKQSIAWIFHCISTLNMHLLFKKIDTRCSLITCLLTVQYRPNLCVWIWKFVTKNTLISYILQFLFSLIKTLSFWPPVTVVDYVVSLGNRHSTFREKLEFSCPVVVILKNISLHEDVCASLFRNVGKPLPTIEASHIRSKKTESFWSHPGRNWRILSHTWRRRKERRIF